MEIRLKKVEVKTTRTDIKYSLPCCHNMGRVVTGEEYHILGISDWDDLRKNVKHEIDKGKYSIIKFCPYCGKQLNWEETNQGG
jgi:hypothetical protein